MRAIYSKVTMDSQCRMLFAGVRESSEKSGQIRHIKSFQKNELPDFEDFIAHDHRGVTQIQISTEDKYLVSGGNDGVICVFQINDGETGGKVQLTEEDERY